MKLKIRKIHDLAILPSYAHPGDAGLDLYSIDDIDIAAGDVALIHTGIAIALPPGTEAQIRPRSGLALKHSVTVLNTPGTIDEGYRGEIGVILINHSKRAFQVVKGMKIAQMVIKPVLQVEVEETDELSQTVRGPQGFGSTGMS
ncbi:dUTP diphosphatase [Phormidium tenue]|uniref:Deoxyuridine 5'-triphosphate nucleotidohydrolase n=1 Tax=Phormidium tenue NIES-30 TaxID=549789 RepID=A0A1U7J7A4_9CYAN|nr:dUTP diphosphatase [Phormidium tenue]MBD2231573.1 dUTP diphosphatase [Phormidium tenue FACHB-1052]OKH49045.1 deoxyuridine 5'-triphosphate nucleotidohydrolase [Phormidium tenue NIES-30]